MAVRLGEHEWLRDFQAAEEYLQQLVAEGADDCPNLIRVDNAADQGTVDKQNEECQPDRRTSRPGQDRPDAVWLGLDRSGQYED